MSAFEQRLPALVETPTYASIASTQDNNTRRNVQTVNAEPGGVRGGYRDRKPCGKSAG